MTPDVQQMPRDTTVPEAQTTPTAPVGEPPITPSAATGQGWNWLLRILGIVMAFGGGIALMATAALLPWNTIPEADNWTLLGVLVAESLFWGFVAALLLRSWWAILIVPVAFSAGIYLYMLYQAFQWSGFNLQQWLPSSGDAMPYWMLRGTLPATIGAVIGALFGKWVGRRIPR